MHEMADKPKKVIEWEEIRGTVKGKAGLLDSRLDLYRAKVPGGWVICVGPHGSTFYPDQNHTWDGNSLP